MKIIYDESKAIREKQEIDAETPDKNRQAKLQNTLRLIGYLLGVILVAFGIHWVRDYLKSFAPDNGTHELINITYWIAHFFICAATVFLYHETRDDVLTAD